MEDNKVVVLVDNLPPTIEVVALEVETISLNPNNPILPIDPSAKCATNQAILFYSVITNLIILTNLMLLNHSLPILLLLILIQTPLGIIIQEQLTISLMIWLI